MRGSHTLILRADGTVWAMGANWAGQLGDGTTIARMAPVQVPGFVDVIAVAAGGLHSLALRRDGTVWAWGWNGSGECARPFSSGPVSPVQVTLPSIVAIAAGQYHSVALSATGSVYTWGNGVDGQLGYGNTDNRYVPVAPVGGVKAIACGGGGHTLALMQDGSVRGWGANYSGQVMSPPGNPVLSPTLLPGGAVTAIAAGYDHSLELNTYQQVLGWGANDQLQLGTGHGSGISAVAGLNGATAIAAGNKHTLARLADGTLRGLGYNLNGQLGNGTALNAGTPVAVPGLGTVMTFAAGPQCSLAVRPDGTLWAWGDSSNGALGLPMSTQKNIPIQLLSPELYEVNAFAANLHNVVTHPDDSLWTWGSNTGGQLGLGDTISRGAPLQVANMSALQVAAGSAYSLALRPDHSVAAWGNNGYGQLGNNGAVSMSSTPLIIPNLTNIGMLAAGSTHALAISQTGGQVWAWGGGSKGQLGNGTTANRLVPTAVSNLTNVQAVAAGGAHSLALVAGGAVWAWGDGLKGQLGNAGTANSLVPVRVGPSSLYLNDGWAIAAGYNHSLAIKADHTVVTWGDNAQGQLGDDTLLNRTTPTAVANLSEVVAVAGGTSHSLALRSDGTVWVWGANSVGQLGDNTTLQRKTPVQVLGLSGIVAIAAGTNHNLARKADGSLVSWGSNSAGQLGLGLSVARLTPAIVPGINILHAAPGVTITSPVSGTTVVSGEPFTLQVQASDPVSAITKVAYFYEGLSLGESYGAPFSLTLALETWGDFWLTATAYNEDNTPSFPSPPVLIHIPPPITLSATGETDTSIRLNWNWTAVPNASTSFKINRRLADTVFAEVGTAAAGATSYLDGSLAADTPYYYRVVGYNGGNITAMSQEVAGMGLLLAPPLLRATPLAQGINLTWQGGYVPPTGEYIIERREGLTLGGFYTPWHELTRVPGTTTAHLDTRLAFGQFAFYRLRASSGTRVSADSNLVHAAMWLAPAPGGSSGGSGSGGTPNPDDPSGDTNPADPPGGAGGQGEQSGGYQIPGDGDGDGDPDNDKDGIVDTSDSYPDDPDRSRDLEAVNYAGINASEGYSNDVKGIALGEGNKLAFWWNASSGGWGVAVWENGQVAADQTAIFPKTYEDDLGTWTLSAPVGIAANGDLAGTATRQSASSSDDYRTAIYTYSLAGSTEATPIPVFSHYSKATVCLGMTPGGVIWGTQERHLEGSIYLPRTYTNGHWRCPYTVTFIGTQEFPDPPTVDVEPPGDGATSVSATVRWSGLGSFTPKLVSYAGTAAAGDYAPADPDEIAVGTVTIGDSTPTILQTPEFGPASRSVWNGSIQPVFAPDPDDESEVLTISDGGLIVGSSPRLTNQDPDAPPGAAHLIAGQPGNPPDVYAMFPADVKKQVRTHSALAQSPGVHRLLDADSLEGAGLGQWISRKVRLLGSSELKLVQLPANVGNNVQINDAGNAAAIAGGAANFLPPFEIEGHKRGTINSPGAKVPKGTGQFGYETVMLENADFQDNPRFQRDCDSPEVNKTVDDDFVKVVLKWPKDMKVAGVKLQLKHDGMEVDATKTTPETAVTIKGPSRLNFYKPDGTKLTDADLVINDLASPGTGYLAEILTTGGLTLFIEGKDKFGYLGPDGPTMDNVSAQQTAAKKLGGAILQWQVTQGGTTSTDKLLVYRGGFLLFEQPDGQPGAYGLFTFYDGKGRVTNDRTDYGEQLAQWVGKSGKLTGGDCDESGGNGHIPPGWRIVFRRTDFSATQRNRIEGTGADRVIRQGGYCRWVQDDATAAAQRYTTTYEYRANNAHDAAIGEPTSIMFKFQTEVIPPTSAANRSEIQIHPDGKKDGTAGCIGIQDYTDCADVFRVLTNYHGLKLKVELN